MRTALEDALFARRAQGMKLGLAAVEQAWRALGQPCADIPVLHVVGTNGKGSTAAMCAQGLLTLRDPGAGPVGLFTSPHLHAVTERVRLDGVACEDAELEAAVAQVLATEQQSPGGGFQDEGTTRLLTFFEVLTLAALLVFEARGASAIVLEAGLGGRLDATRVVPARLVVVTRIGLDHQAFLGDTLVEIAWEKAGAIRDGVGVVTVPQAPEVLAVLERAASHVGAPLRIAAPRPRAPLALLGPHQRENAGLAAAALTSFLRTLPSVAGRSTFRVAADEDEAAAAFEQVSWPGRFEVTIWGSGGRGVDRRAVIVFDCAHNLQGIETLARTWTEQFDAPPDLVVFGCMADKDAPAMWRSLPRAGVRLVVPPPREGAHPLRPRLGAGLRLDGPEDARLWRALEEVAMARGRVLVCGSFFLVAALRARLLGGAAAAGAGRPVPDRLDLSDPVPRGATR